MPEPLLHLTAAPLTVTADLETRTIRGLAVEWNVVGLASTGPVRFLPGSLTPSPHLLLRDHDPAKAVGRVTGAETDELGARITAKVSEVAAGDEALILASDGVLTGLSVGVRPTVFERVEDPDHGEVLEVTAGEWEETSLVAFPAFTNARISDVAASANQKEAPVTEQTVETVEETETPAVVAAAPRVSSTVTAARALPTAGEYLFASIKRHEAPQRWEDMQAVVRAAAPHTFVADVPGLIPAPIVGDVFAGRPEDRPIVDSLGPRTGPDGGKTFSRPVISDPLLDAAVIEEKTDATDQLKVTGVDFTYEYVKRAFNLSAEAIAFTSPEVLDVALRDLGRAYTRGTEKVAATALEAIDGTASAVAAEAFEDAVAAASAAMYVATGEQVDRIWLSVGAWQHLYGLKDSQGRPVFPRIGPANANGTNGGIRGMGLDIGGIAATVSWALTANVAVVGSSAVIECYENHRITMRADEPTILGVAGSVGGAIALGALNAAGASKFTVAAQTVPTP
jgi:HK97 family phage prohead protease